MCLLQLIDRFKIKRSLGGFVQSLYLHIALIFIVSCGSEKAPENFGDPFLDKIAVELSELKVKGMTTVSPDSPLLSNPYKMVVDNSGRFIVAEAMTFYVTMLDRQGRILSRAGGNGAGPGEFRVINDLTLGSDSRLYVLDKGLQRITVFEISSDDLVLDRVIAVDGRDDYRLQNLIVSEAGWFGLYKRIDARASGDHRFRLFSIDDSVNRKELLLVLPGEMESSFSDRFENFLGVNTHFTVHSSGFYYISSHSTELIRFDLADLTSRSVVILQPELRKNNIQAREFMKNRMQQIIVAFPEYGVMIDETRELPIFQHIVRNDNFIILTPFYFEENLGMVLFYDLRKSETNYIRLSQPIKVYGYNDNILYGIDYMDGKDSIISLIHI